MRVRSSVLVLFVLLLSVSPSYAAPAPATRNPVADIVKRLRNLVPKSLGDFLSPPLPRKSSDCGKSCG